MFLIARKGGVRFGPYTTIERAIEAAREHNARQQNQFGGKRYGQYRIEQCVVNARATPPRLVRIITFMGGAEIDNENPYRRKEKEPKPIKDPLVQLAYDILSEDPVACDMGRDVIKI